MKDPRLTRRDALAAGAVLGGGILLGAAAGAGAATPAQALAKLRDEIRDSRVDSRLRSRLLAFVRRARADLEDGDPAAAAQALRGKLKPLLKRNRGRHGLSERQAARWIADVEEIVSSIGPGAGGRFGTVYIFNLNPSPLRVVDLNGQGSPVREIPKPTQDSGWVPSQDRVSRTNLNLAQLNAPVFVNSGRDSESNTLRFDLDGDRRTIQVRIPDAPDLRLETDLFLYLANGDFFLLDQQTGSVIRQR